MPRTKPTPKKDRKPGQWVRTGSSPTPKICEIARRLCLLGLDNTGLQFHLGVSRETYARWLKQFPEFKEAITRGKGQADGHVAESLYHQTLGAKIRQTKLFFDGATVTEHTHEQQLPPNITATIFWLKNRHPELWRDVSKKEISMDGPIRLDSPTIIDITNYMKEEREELEKLLGPEDEEEGGE